MRLTLQCRKWFRLVSISSSLAASVAVYIVNSGGFIRQFGVCPQASLPLHTVPIIANSP